MTHLHPIPPSSIRPRERAPETATLVVVSPSRAERRRLAALVADIGCTVLEASSPETAQALGAASVDLVLLHCRALAGEELAFCRTLGGARQPPLVLVVAEKADLVDEIVALEIGADDLIAEPASDRLILARAKALMRRASPRRESARAHQSRPGWRLNPTTRAATSPAGRTVVLSPSDASAFHLFLENPDVVFTSEAGARAVGTNSPSPASFRTTVCRLRKKLDALGDGEPIRTVRGVGYVYGAPLSCRSVAGDDHRGDAIAA